ncbi:hypothetical protein [Acinetobacter courvalinii]|uniref:hypothetical protein n=1 Tax=Acinetobacter courvalinii TaxID=280147 RepID=UPI0021D0188F|nr:hypothetical protein [Acinetobacter courvalinii]MCU4367551.1 hypothetical protein [Acinetobacter courvalinii]MCU4445757.1 hypothetical protein [Acinetobacter courvalinii]
MKKINFNELIVIGIGILATCFFISQISLLYFNLQTDFLSATATLFAAIIAFILFNDWKEQYKTELFERIKNHIHNAFLDLEKNYNDLYVFLISSKELPKAKELVIKITVLQNSIDQLMTELDFYEKLLTKYKNINITPKHTPADVKFYLTNLLNTMKPVYEKGKYNEFVDNYKNILSTNNQYKKIITYKIFVNDDLQKIILSTLDDEKKGP